MDSISPNQNQNCVAVGTAIGYNVFSLKDLSLLTKQEKPGETLAVKFIEMYYLTNILLLVYQNSPSDIVVWDDFTQRENDRLEFARPILKMILREKRLYVHTEALTIEIFDVLTFNRIAEVFSVSFFPGMCLEVPSAIDNFIGWNVKDKGEIKLVSLHHLPKIIEESDVILHKNNTCRNFVFNRRGSHLASNSKGTIIKLYDINAKTKRSISINLLGKEIHSLFFVPGHVFLIVVEDGGNVRVLDTSGEMSENVTESTNILQKLTREKSYMDFKIPFRKARVCYNEANKSLFFYSDRGEIVQYEVSFKDRAVVKLRQTGLFGQG